MSFVYPAFLFALFTLAVPIIIHLFNFRRFKKIYFPNVRFLKEIKLQTQSYSRLKHLLVLLTRILSLAFLVFAFSQPYLPEDKTQLHAASSGKQTISIFIDNSFSMDGINDNGRLFEQAQQLARDIGMAYQPTDNFQLLTNNFESRHQRLVNREELIELIDETEISSFTRNLSEIITRQKDATTSEKYNNSKKTFFIISDFQKTICDFNSILPDSNFQVKLIPIKSSVKNNLYIDSCWFVSPVRKLNSPDEMHLRIVNKSDNNYENIPIKLLVNGQVKAIGTSFSIPPVSIIDTVLNFTTTSAGWQKAVVEITDYPITFDDKFYLSFEIAENLNILCISPEDSNSIQKTEAQKQSGLKNLWAIQNLFGKDNYFSLRFSSFSQIDYSSFPKNNMIILLDADSISSGLGQELKKFTESGGSLLVFPSAKIDLSSFKEFLLNLNLNYFESFDTSSTKVEGINLEHIIFSDVFDSSPSDEDYNLDLPAIHKQYIMSRFSKTNEEWLLKTQKGNNILSRYTFGNGFVNLFSISLGEDFSNFSKHALFVPTLYQIALNSKKNSKLFNIIGRDNFIKLNRPLIQLAGNDNIFHIVSEDNTLDFIPEIKVTGAEVQLYLHDLIVKSGNFTVARGNEIPECSAFNYDRKESDITPYIFSELEREIQERGLKNFNVVDSNVKFIGQKLGEISRGTSLWKYCIIFALFFLTAEVALLKWWKRNK